MCDHVPAYDKEYGSKALKPSAKENTVVPFVYFLRLKKNNPAPFGGK